MRVSLSLNSSIIADLLQELKCYYRGEGVAHVPLSTVHFIEIRAPETGQKRKIEETKNTKVWIILTC